MDPSLQLASTCEYDWLRLSLLFSNLGLFYPFPFHDLDHLTALSVTRFNGLNAPKNRRDADQIKQISTNFALELLASHARRETSTNQ